MTGIKTRYGLKNYPYKIWALDISHISGSRTAWAIVSMVGWVIYKKWYRRYKLSDLKTPWDDYEALENVIQSFDQF